MPAVIVLIVSFLVGVVTHMPASHAVQSEVKGESTVVVSPTSTPTPIPTIVPTATPTLRPTSTIYVYPTVVPTSNGLSNDNTYINSSGNEVHSPAYSNTVPAGATAQCKDGEYSFSQHRSGTCSGHGGVAKWL